MDFRVYHEHAKETDNHRPEIRHLLYGSNALNGEAGEFANKVKKLYRRDGHDIVISARERNDLIEELGGVLWYLDLCAELCNTTLDDVARFNLEQLKERYRRDRD